MQVICFNLLSEILFVQACSQPSRRTQKLEFQSLERDSVCSSPGVNITTDTPPKFQSLERDSVCSSQYIMPHQEQILHVSIS